MRAVIQRVSSASVVINGTEHDAIGPGLLILLGITEEDTADDIDYLVQKICMMRIFSDAEGKMNLSVRDKDGRIMVISQFTLFAQTRKGNRPSFIQAARPETAIPLYEEFLLRMDIAMEQRTARGLFGADMKVSLINDGPVTIVIDSKNKDL